MNKNIIIRKGQYLLYYPQPEAKPIVVICCKQKGAGKEIVLCREKGKDKIRKFTTDKLEVIMKGYDKWKLETSPDDAEKYEGKDKVTFELNKQELEFTFEFDGYTNDEGGYDINMKSFEITKIEVVTSLEGFPAKLDRTDILLELVPNEHWIEVLDEQIKSCFTGTTYNLCYE